MDQPKGDDPAGSPGNFGGVWSDGWCWVLQVWKNTYLVPPCLLFIYCFVGVWSDGWRWVLQAWKWWNIYVVEFPSSVFVCLKLIYCTRLKPAYRRKGLGGGIVGTGYSSSGYILGSSQRLALRPWRSAQIGYCCSKCSESQFLDFLNMVDWKSSTDPLEEVMTFLDSQGSQLTGGLFRDSGGGPNWPFRCFDRWSLVWWYMPPCTNIARARKSEIHSVWKWKSLFPVFAIKSNFLLYGKFEMKMMRSLIPFFLCWSIVLTLWIMSSATNEGRKDGMA